MVTIAWYLLKVIICSGVLVGYYWLFLRNRVFHQYNRFYLLAAVLLSITLPLVKINFWEQSTTSQPAFLYALQTLSRSDAYLDEVVITVNQSNWGITDWASVLYVLISLFFFMPVLYSLYMVIILLKKNPQQQLGDIAFINTNAKGTPFSFFKYIFWNYNIDIGSTTGDHIFKHEIAHIREKHSYDKMLMNIVLVLFWCNPFFWLLRKEINMIHEFVADKKAVGDSDVSVFAAMVLQSAYPQQTFPITNNFFYSPIKRRIAMLVKNKNSKVSYAGRLLVLPLLLLVFTAFTLKHKKEVLQLQQQLAAIVEPARLPDLPLALVDSPPQATAKPVAKPKEEPMPKENAEEKPLVVLDGKIIEGGMEQLNTISTADIESMSVLKGKNATTLYGNAGTNGVVAVTTKAASIKQGNKNNILTAVEMPVSSNGKNSTTTMPSYDDMDIYINGQPSTKEVLQAIDPQKIAGIDVKKLSATTTLGKIGSINVRLKNEADLDNLDEIVAVTAVKPGAKNNAQTINGTVQEQPRIVFTKTEQPAAYTGGNEAWKKYLREHVNSAMPISDGWGAGTYKIIVQFIVYKDGTVGDIKALNYADSKTAAHCVALIKKSGNWKPALQNGHAVDAYRKQPITFVVNPQTP
jgi:TonB-dependent SusC/RagA subfamily outer membrane receptor